MNRYDRSVNSLFRFGELLRIDVGQVTLANSIEGWRLHESMGVAIITCRPPAWSGTGAVHAVLDASFSACVKVCVRISGGTVDVSERRSVSGGALARPSGCITASVTLGGVELKCNVFEFVVLVWANLLRERWKHAWDACKLVGHSDRSQLSNIAVRVLAQIAPLIGEGYFRHDGLSDEAKWNSRCLGNISPRLH